MGPSGLDIQAQQEAEDMVSPRKDGVSLFISSHILLYPHFQQVKHAWIPVVLFLQTPVTTDIYLARSCSIDRQVNYRHIRNSVGGGALGSSLPPRADLQRTQPFFLQYPSQFLSLLHLFGISVLGLWELSCSCSDWFESVMFFVLMSRFAVQVSFRITEDTWQSASSRRLRREFQERGKVLRGCPA